MSAGFIDVKSASPRKRKENGKNPGRGRSGNSTAYHFKPGNPGGGRPKKTALDDALKQLAETDVAEVLGPKGKVVISADMTVAQAMSLGVFQHAMKGNARMAQLFAERTGGKPRQQIDLNVGATQDLAERMERSWSRAKGEE